MGKKKRTGLKANPPPSPAWTDNVPIQVAALALLVFVTLALASMGEGNAALLAAMFPKTANFCRSRSKNWKASGGAPSQVV